MPVRDNKATSVVNADMITPFTVQSKTIVISPDGTEIPTWQNKFSQTGSFKRVNARQILDSGALVFKTYDLLVYRAETNNTIEVSDKVIVNGIEYTPSTDNIDNNFEHRRFSAVYLTRNG